MAKATFAKRNEQQPPLTEEQTTEAAGLSQYIENNWDHDVKLAPRVLVNIMTKHAEVEDDDERMLAIVQEVLKTDKTYEGDIPEELPADENQELVDAEVAAAMSATEFDEDAIKMANRIEGNTTLLSNIHELMEAKTSTKMLPATIAYGFMEMFTKTEIEQFPLPFSKYKDPGYPDGTPAGNKVPDVGKPGELGYYAQVAFSIKEGNQLRLRRMALAQSIGKGSPDDPKIELPIDCQGKSTKWREGEFKTASDRLSAYINAVRDGMLVAMYIHKLGDETDLNAEIMYDEESKCVVRSHVPIQVYYLREVEKRGEKTNVVVDRYVSVTTFINVMERKLSVIKKLGDVDAQWQQFEIKRGRKGGSAKTTPISVSSAPKLREAFDDIVGRVRGSEASAYNSDVHAFIQTDEGPEFLDSAFKLEVWLRTEITNRQQYRTMVDDFRKKRNAAAGVTKVAEEAA